MEPTKEVIICMAVLDGEKIDGDEFIDAFPAAWREIVHIHTQKYPVEASTTLHRYVTDKDVKFLRKTHRWRFATLMKKLRTPVS